MTTDFRRHHEEDTQTDADPSMADLRVRRVAERADAHPGLCIRAASNECEQRPIGRGGGSRDAVPRRIAVASACRGGGGGRASGSRPRNGRARGARGSIAHAPRRAPAARRARRARPRPLEPPPPRVVHAAARNRPALHNTPRRAPAARRARRARTGLSSPDNPRASYTPRRVTAFPRFTTRRDGQPPPRGARADRARAAPRRTLSPDSIPDGESSNPRGRSSRL